MKTLNEALGSIRGEVSVASKGHLAVMPDAEQLKETLNNVIEH